MRGLRTILGAVPIVLVLSTITWAIVYYAFPDAPLKPKETALIVFIWTGLILAFQGLLKRRKSGGGEKSK